MDKDSLTVRVAVHKAITDLTDTSDGGKLVEVLSSTRRYLGQGTNPASAQEIAEFNKIHYITFLRFLVAQMGPRWMDFLSPDHLDLWESFFLEGPADQAFLVLSESLGQTGPSIRQDQLSHALERFLQRGGLTEVIWVVCQQQLETTPTPFMHETILAKICSLPDHVANCMQKHKKSIFYPANYYPLVGNAILKVLQKVSVSLREGKGCSINFVSQVLGKVCMQGRPKELFSVLVPRLTSLVNADCIWQRICWRLVESVPDRWIEPVVTGLVFMAPGPAALSQLLGDLVLKNKKTLYVLTQKLIFLHYSHKAEMLQNIFGYLSLNAERRRILVKVLQEVLQVWSSSCMVKNSPYPQMLHLSRCIFICISLLNKQEIEECYPDLIYSMTKGTGLYLDSTLPPVRCLGMVVAEFLSTKLDPDLCKLQFTYEEDEDIKELKSLVKPPCRCQSEPVKASSEKVPVANTDKKPEEQPNGDAGSDSELDSDDDLTPYDMSADTELKKSKAPAYIRDSMEVLLSDDVEKLEVTMTSLATLIRSNPSATKEVSAELAKILLHLDDRSGVESFLLLRFAALVAVTVIDPVAVSQYLTGEFYSLNYNLRQRMDILDVLATAAQELSESPATDKPAAPKKQAAESSCHSVEACQDHCAVDWRKIVEERIASKTKRFAKEQPKPTPTPAPNRFHAVAGHFFFPLMQNFDRPVNTFNLLGDDHLVLGRLVHTLGIFMHLALHATVVSQMGKSLLEFVWVLRYHTDHFVRQGLLFCVSTILLSVPWERLMTDMAEEVLEMKCWLEDVAEKDTDDDCRRVAVNGLILMDKLKNNLQPAPIE
ncbi:telomere length regulation protein TEL2 homolog isoform X2 [Hyperolius riggenbachi]